MALETTADQIEFTDGRFSAPRTNRSFDVFELAREVARQAAQHIRRYHSLDLASARYWEILRDSRNCGTCPPQKPLFQTKIFFWMAPSMMRMSPMAAS